MKGLFNALIFSPAQMAICIIVGVVLAALVGLNVYLFIIYREKQERKLHDGQLEEKRKALLDKLEYLKAGGEPEKKSSSWLDYVIDDDEEEDENGKKYVTVRMAVGDQPVNAAVLSVDELTPRVRRKLGFRAKRHDGKKFYVRYSLGFDARLRYSDDETKQRYMSVMDEAHKYGMSAVKQFSNLRICVGKEIVAVLLFGGKKLCVAFALNPADYEKTKYRGEDKSDKKKFAKTPLLIRVGSDEKLEVVKHLFGVIADKYSLAVKPRKVKYDLEERSQEEMIAKGSVRVIVIDEVHNVVSKRATHVVVDDSKTKPDVTVPTVITASVPEEEDVGDDTADETASAEEEEDIGTDSADEAAAAKN